MVILYRLENLLKIYTISNNSLILNLIVANNSELIGAYLNVLKEFRIVNNTLCLNSLNIALKGSAKIAILGIGGYDATIISVETTRITSSVSEFQVYPSYKDPS